MKVTKKNFFSLLVIVLLGVSLSLNLYLLNDKKQMKILVENSMSNHLALFGGSLYPSQVNGGFYDLLNDPIRLSICIQDMRESLMYFQTAHAIENHATGFQSKHLMEQYVYALEWYRSALIKGEVDKYEYDINLIFDDLSVICNWLNDKAVNKEFKVYSDDEFYNDVYGQLKSEIVEESMYFKVQ